MQETNTTKSATVLQQLQQAANKYETKEFFTGDPSQFLLYSKDEKETELITFFAAMMSFGMRSQFIPKINSVLNCIEENHSFYQWILNSEYKNDIQNLAKKFHQTSDLEKKYYRLYSYNDLIMLFDKLKSILLFDKCENKNEENASFGNYFKVKYEKSNENSDLADLIAEEFLDCKIVPHTKNSCKKKIYMFLRWMVRQNSPVDLGLWNWYPQSKLLIPLDTHVMQEAIKLELLEKDAKADIKTARKLTNLMKEIFPNDPAKADFALFGIGVEKERLK